MKKRIYIAGKMRGVPKYNFPAFRSAAQEWREKGWDVISPAEMDEAIGFTENDPEPGEEFLRDAITRDIASLMLCDAIAVLPGWEDSRGVAVELALAKFLGLPVYFEQWRPK